MPEASALFLLGIFIGMVLGYLVATRGPREPFESAVTAPVSPPLKGTQAFEDAVYLWRVKHGKRVKHNTMTAVRWNKAVMLLEFLDLYPNKMDYERGVQVIREELEAREKLRGVESYVAPY